MKINCLATVVAITAIAVVACSPVAPPNPPAPPTVDDTPGQAALDAYRRFVSVVDAAFAAPRSKAWDTDLQGVATGQALDSALADIKNYASLPAHVEGSIRRMPAVSEASSDRVSIMDCFDLGDSRLVSDVTGEVFDDLKNRVTRYRFRAELAGDPSGKWLVDRTAPALAEPC